MIFVDRHRVPPPPELIAFQKKEFERFGSRPDPDHLEQDLRRPMPAKVRNAVVTRLNALFQGKCAFCERAGSNVERFRPRWRAMRIGKRIDGEHYWWLANEWSNLYLSCPECNLNKRNLFPIEGDPAPVMTTGSLLDAERPLLIDPCRDIPREHLRFEPDGQVVATSSRGAATIEILKLNSPYLVSARQSRAAHAQAIFNSDMPGERRSQVLREQFPSSGYHHAVFEMMAARFEQALSSNEDSEPPEVPPSPAVAALPDAVWLKTIEIQNFKSIDKLKLVFPEPQSRDDVVMQPWLMVLGENGVGKSTLLQAVALALMPDSERQDLVAAGKLQPAEGWLNRAGSGRKGWVRLTFSDESARTLSFQSGSPAFQVEGDAPPLPVLAYGSTRLLSEAETDDRSAAVPSISVRNLFDPRHPLTNAERMLCDEQRLPPENFKLLAEDLQGLLPLTGNATLSRKDGRMETMLHGTPVPLDELSGGYQSVLALAMDIMIHLTSSSFDMESAQGVVMIDEIELHLHPRWKIQVVAQLRQLFPRVRFIVSTHDPLCVQGLHKGELWVMARHAADRRLAVEQINVPAGTRADEVLTGPWFGMQATIDADTLDLMARHSALLHARKRTKAQERDLERMALELRDRMHTFGHTRSHRAALAAAASLEQELSRAEADPRIRGRLRQILDDGAGAKGISDA
ncbi:AAA family ATPase [Roseateles sp. 22389]|uniref:AAA family ATPase n=1 Tax=Roseateles sp. 22389 TaxID=3453916 RepID=UPI003F87A5AA